MKRQQPNFIKTTIKKADIGSDTIKVGGQTVKLPFIVKAKDVGKTVAYNLNKSLKLKEEK